MAAPFNTFGLPARAVHGGTSRPQRQQAIADLRSGVIKAIFSVDLFNEGVDIPELNTLLLLRPSQSPVLFIQQLGRGLRLSHGKDRSEEHTSELQSRGHIVCRLLLEYN